MDNSIKIEAKEKLKENLNKIIKNESSNRELGRVINEEFTEKNLNPRLIYSIFNEGT